MELKSRIKMAIFQTFWIQIRKNKPLDESRKSSQTSGTKMAFHSKVNIFTTKKIYFFALLFIRKNGTTVKIITQKQNHIRFKGHDGSQHRSAHEDVGIELYNLQG
ncbi:hypothetical protein Hanom_Chr10g00947701 [Helianthus anomalus]